MKKDKIIIHKYKNGSNLPDELIKFWVEYVDISSLDGIFKIKENEILVKVGDYLVYDKKKLKYYPKEIWECRDNKEFVSYKSLKRKEL